MKYIILVLLSVPLSLLLLITAPKQATPLNNQETRTVNVTKAAAQANPRNVSPVGVKAKAAKPIKKVSKPKPKITYPRTHVQLMAAAGIQSKDYASADYIISHESSWNPNATEPITLAHGLPQALPYSKTGCGWSDSICQLRWANRYAVERYGNWSKAQVFWSVNRNW